MSVIPEAPAAAMYPRPEEEIAAARERYDLPEQYLLWVGGLQHPDPRKRVAALAATSRHMPLVLVGHAQQWAHELPDVTLTGHVSDDELAAIYSGAHALVFPSDDEGFGLPTVEALACGLPVVACDVPALREVLADRATFVERRDMRGLMDAAEAIQRPAPKPPDWSWNDAGRATWEVYRTAAAAAADRHGSRMRGPRTGGGGPAPTAPEIGAAPASGDDRRLARASAGVLRNLAACRVRAWVHHESSSTGWPAGARRSSRTPGCTS